MESDRIKHFFPIELLDHFDYRSSQIKMGEHGEYLEVEFEEKNELPQGYSRVDYESKDLLVRRVQDFPIRSHAVFLKLRRRRWRHKETGETISRDLSFISEGSRFTKEGRFFKRYPSSRGLSRPVWSHVTVRGFAFVREFRAQYCQPSTKVKLKNCT